MKDARAQAVAAVTGGSAGIGKAICADLLEQGYEVVSLARRPCDLTLQKSPYRRAAGSL